MPPVLAVLSAVSETSAGSDFVARLFWILPVVLLAGKFSAASTRKATSSTSFRANLRDDVHPVA